MFDEQLNNLYDVLLVSSKADSEMIERAYRLLAKRYHPDSGNGNAQKFDQLVKAYRTLSDPEKRKHYDAYNGNTHSPSNQASNDALMIDFPEDDEKVYQSILFLLYWARKRDALKAGVGVVALERDLRLSEKYLDFHLWYLKEKGWIERLDTGGYAITAAGVDATIEKKLMRKKHLLLLPGLANTSEDTKDQN